MSKKGARFLVMAGVLFFMLTGIVYAAKLEIKIDPNTGKPVVKTDVPVVSSTTTHTGWTVVSLATGEKVAYFVTPEGSVSVEPLAGVINVVAGNAVATVQAGEAVAVSVNAQTNAAQVVATKGVVDVSAQGKRIKLKPGQQSVVTPGTPPTPPAPAPSIPTPPAPPTMPAPAPAPAPAAAAPAPVAPTPAPPPKYQVNPNIQPPTPATPPEEYHGQPPASPAE